jgi:hypothetical protein
MSPGRARWLEWAFLSLSAAALVGTIVLAALNGFENAWGWGTEAVVFVICVPGLAFSIVGALVASRQPRNAVGWICLTVGVGIPVTIAASEYARYAIETNPGSLPAGELVASLASWDWLVWVGLLVIYLPFFFPNGHLPSRRWRLVAWAGGVGIVLVGVSAALLPGPIYEFPDVRNPLGLEGAKGELDAISAVGFALFVLCVPASASSMVVRFRRAGGAERVQIKWFALAAALLAAMFVPVAVASSLSPSYDETAQGVLIAQDLLTLAFAAPAVATGIAILRYRLYDIDVVINRTLVYGALTATLAAAYLASVLLLQLGLRPLTESSNLAIGGSTLAVAALFRPARARIQGTVDRRFYRRKYDAQHTLEAFSARLRDQVDLGALNSELRAVVRETLQPAHVSLWLRAPEARR